MVVLTSQFNLTSQSNTALEVMSRLSIRLRRRDGKGLDGGGSLRRGCGDGVQVSPGILRADQGPSRNL